MSAPLLEVRQALAACNAVLPTIPYYPPETQVSGPKMHEIMRHLDRRMVLDHLIRDLEYFIREWEHYDTEGVP